MFDPGNLSLSWEKPKAQGESDLLATICKIQSWDREECQPSLDYGVNDFIHRITRARTQSDKPASHDARDWLNLFAALREISQAT